MTAMVNGRVSGERDKSEGLDKNGLRMELSATYDDPGRERDWLAAVTNQSIDGVILLLPLRQSRLLQGLRKQHVPFVTIEALSELPPALLDIPEPPTAIIASNDLQASGVHPTQFAHINPYGTMTFPQYDGNAPPFQRALRLVFLPDSPLVTSVA